MGSRRREIAQQPLHDGLACPLLEEERACNTEPCEGVVTSTNFPNNYPNDQNKTHTIRVGEGLVIGLKFTAFNVESDCDDCYDCEYDYLVSEDWVDCNNCSYDHLVIEDGDGTTLMEKRCGNTLPSGIVSKSNIVNLHFTTDVEITKPGWRVTWIAGKPGQNETISRLNHILLDCMVAEWSAWGNCSETCGGGTSSRRREVAQQPLHGGKACPILEEERACNTELCVSVDCVVAEWSTWGSCSKTCGEGTMLRRREVAQQPIHDGEACPVLEEEIVCNTGLCEGVVTSTNYPYNYPNDHNKTQTIRVGEGFIIWLKFPAFDVEWHFDCRYDHLVIEDGDGTTLMEKRCGTTLPSKVFSKSNIVKLHFTTDGSTTKSGWRVNWTARKPATFVFSSVAGQLSI